MGLFVQDSKVPSWSVIGPMIMQPLDAEMKIS